MAYVYRKRKAHGKPSGYYRAHYKDASGEEQDHVIVLPNGERTKFKEVAERWLRDRMRRVERESVGLVDPYVERARSKAAALLDEYLKHVEGRGNTERYVKDIRRMLTNFFRANEITTVAEFGQTERLAAGIRQIASSSPRTANLCRAYLHGYGEFLLKVARVLANNPAATLPFNKCPARKVRRALTIDEARALVGVSSPAAAFYAVALWSGLRKGEIAALRWTDVALGGDRPAFKLRAEATKSRRSAELPIHSSLVPVLDGLPRRFDTVFNSTPNWRAWARDYKAAGIELDGSVDVHALRTTFISWLGLYGVDPRAQIALARHSARGVTMAHYQDFRVFDLWSEIERLPPIRGDHVLAQDIGA